MKDSGHKGILLHPFCRRQGRGRGAVGRVGEEGGGGGGELQLGKDSKGWDKEKSSLNSIIQLYHITLLFLQKLFIQGHALYKNTLLGTSSLVPSSKSGKSR